MSTVKLASLQLGKSGTATLNYHWRNLLDGILRLTRGNVDAPGADIIQVNADNSVSFPGNVASGVLGAGQTWQDVTGSRASGVTYTNTTGKAIAVSISGQSASGSSHIVTVNGVIIASAGGGGIVRPSTQFIVPNESTFSVVIVNGAGLLWTEFS